MTTGLCPYPEKIVDEISGVVVPNDKYHDWMAGYNARSKELENVSIGLNDLARDLDEAVREMRSGAKR